MSGARPPLPQYAFMAWYSVKVYGQLYFYLDGVEWIHLAHDTDQCKAFVNTVMNLWVLGKFLSS
jgi:hypothetical protein